MQFLGVGWEEVLLIGVLAFFVLGPERLPVVAYQIGKAVRTLQGYARAVRDEFGEELSYVEDQYKTVRGDFADARKEVRAQQRSIEDEWRSQQRELQAGVDEARTAVEGAGKVVSITDRSPVGPAAAAAGVTAAALPVPAESTVALPVPAESTVAPPAPAESKEPPAEPAAAPEPIAPPGGQPPLVF